MDKKIFENGIVNLPVVYQLVETVANTKAPIKIKAIKMEVYSSNASRTIKPNKPVSKIL